MANGVIAKEPRERHRVHRADFTKSARIQRGDRVLYSPASGPPREMVCSAPPADIGYEAIWLEGMLGPVRLEQVEEIQQKRGPKPKQQRRRE